MLTGIDISVEVVFSKLFRLKSYKSPGPDNIHSYILKACASNPALCTTIFNI